MSDAEENKATVAEMAMAKLKNVGVKRMFGLPGGGSSLDLIDAATKLGMDFHLTRREDSAVMMAAVTADLTGAPGVVLTTKGPGTANAANGVAHASLDRSPVIIFTDGFSPQLREFATHQVFDQKAMLGPVVKGHGNLDNNNCEQEFATLLDHAMTPPSGPVHIELTGPVARKTVFNLERADNPKESISVTEESVERAVDLIAGAKKPILVIGLEARQPQVARQIATLVDKLDCPVLVTYKAKGVVADDHPNFIGIFTGGKAEQACVSNADLIILMGLDPVELILQPWPYDLPVLDVACAKHEVHYTEMTEAIYGPMERSLETLSRHGQKSSWEDQEINSHRRDMAARLAFPSNTPLNPQTIVEIAQNESTTNPRLAVDAGAHMISAMAFWRAAAPGDVMISNGLATMGFAVPAAIAAALENPKRGAIAFTGDGGFMMCASELSLAAECHANIVVVVFNDGVLSLIDAKQRDRQLPSIGTSWTRPDFAKVAEGLGCRSWRVDAVDTYKTALQQAYSVTGPALIDVVVDPQGYSQQLSALRG